MPVRIAVPPDRTRIAETDGVLRILDAAHGHIELRVDAGAVFARYLTAEPRVWTDVAVESVIALFASNSPVATFLRQHGANPLRQALVDAQLSGADSGTSAP